ncbi:MAG: MFS transporter [Saprospiraceae bacterium]|nr:MFS transporter [Saprospiraceae bacterium]
MEKERLFTPYQVFIVAVLAFLQFTIILDFMVLSPLGAQLLEALNVSTRQFGLVVSAYAFSAGASGLLAAGFADRFDRKRLLLFFYTGFIAGTFLCGIATSYEFLLVARIVTGLFGGVIGSVIFAVITDLFKIQVRGRVMGFVQMAFAVSQVLGIPLGLYLANIWGWHAPFLLIVGLSIPAFVVIAWKMQPVDAHISDHSERSAFRHLLKTVSKKQYLKGFLATTLLATGGYMLMPFGSAFAVHNLGLTLEQLPPVYMITGICSMIAGPLIGRLSDQWGKYPVFVSGSILSMALVVVYTNLGITPLWVITALNAVLFIGIMSRMISSSALMSALPDTDDRGAFMGVNSSVAQISGGIAAAIAGMIVVQSPDGNLQHYPVLGYVVVASMAVVIWILYYINIDVHKKHRAEQTDSIL